MKELVPVIDKIADKIEIAIQALSNQLSITGENLWRILIKQVYIDVISSGVCIIISSIIVFSWYLVAKFWSKKIQNDGWDDDGNTVIFVISLIVGVIFFIVCGCEIANIISCLCNPEYQALVKILDRL